MTKIVDLLFFDAGGGHRAAMNGLCEALSRLHPDWIVRPVDVQKLLEPVDPIFQSTKRVSPFLQRLAPKKTFQPIQSQVIYNRALKKGATRGMGFGLPVMQFLIRANSDKITKALQSYWRDKDIAKPDLVLSDIPNFNAVAYAAVKGVYPDVPYGTVMTDMVDVPTHFWMENQDQFMICGTDKATAQAKATGFYRPEQIHQVSGMILRQSFYDLPETPRLSRADLGLHADRPTALIMFGGNGSAVSEDIVEQLAKAEPAMQTIVMCGHNDALYERLKGIPGCCPVKFVSNVADYMRVADFAIGKPGPGAISEALHMGLPFITERNGATMPQEIPNAQFIQEHGVGIVVRNLKKEIVPGVRKILANLDHYKQNIQSNIKPNRAVFEIAEILEQIMDARPVQIFRNAYQNRRPKIAGIQKLMRQRFPVSKAG